MSHYQHEHNIANRIKENMLFFPYISAHDIGWFQQRKDEFNEAQLNRIFNLCCLYNASFEFTEQIIDLGVTQMEDGCRVALERENYGLLYLLLAKYGRGYNQVDNGNNGDIKNNVHVQKRINVIGSTFFNIARNVVKLAGNEEDLPLIKLIIELLPNHTQFLSKADKHYDNLCGYNYKIVYNELLHLLLINVTALKAQKPYFTEAIEALAKKPFPLSDTSAQLVEGFGFTHLFAKRMKPKAWFFNQGLAARTQLFHDKPAYVEVLSQKVRIYLELAYHWKIPQSMNEHIEQAINQDLPIILPNEEEFAFLQSISHKPVALKFFKRYYNYERGVLYERLREMVITIEMKKKEEYNHNYSNYGNQDVTFNSHTDCNDNDDKVVKL